MMTEKDDRADQPTQNGIPVAEWIVAAVGGVLVIASFLFLAYRAVSEREPASFEFTIEEIQRVQQQLVATASVHNRGGQPVADLRLRAICKRDQVKEVVIDYVPAKSSRRVTFYFVDADVDAPIEFVVDSFTEP